MKSLKTVLFASAILAGGMLAAGAQTTSPSAGVSAATHCKDAQGNVKLKTANSTELPGTPTKPGATTGSGSSSSGMSGGTSGSTSGSMSGSSSSAAATLPPCAN
jgi:hypothetical protein